MILSKAHLTSHSRMSGSRWVITLSWLSGSWRSFLYSSSVYSCHLFLISSASVMTNLDSILKSRDITLPTKVHLVKAMVFPVVMYGCESWLSEKAMAPHSSTLAWKIPWTEEPGRLQSMRSLRVRHHWATSLSLFTFVHWRRKWQPTPVFLPGESQGQRRLVGCCLWGCTESDTTEVT